MKKTLQAIGLLLALMIVAFPGVFAVGPQTLAAAYVQANDLYVYYENSGDSDAPQLNGRTPDYTVSLAEAGERITYLLAVDRSGSTRNYLDTICQLVDSLNADTPGCVFRLCGFSDNFSADASEYDAGALKTALESLNFAGNTDIFYGLSQTVQALLDSQWKNGELYNLILLTDGWSSGAESEPPVFGDTLPFVLHTYVLGGGGSPDELAKLQILSNGVFVVGGSGEDAGHTIAARVNDITAYTFSLKTDEREPYKLFFTREGAPEITSLSGLHMANDANQPNVQVPPEAGNDTPESAAEPTSPSPTEEKDPPAAEFPDSGKNAVAVSQEQENAPAASGLFIGVMAAVFVLLLAIIALLVVLLLRRRSRVSTPTGDTPSHIPATVPAPGTIPMQLELLEGKILTRERQFFLKDWMIIGSSEDCDLVVDDRETAPRNSRIFFREGYLYIEDLGTKNGTVLGGMRLYAPNRLRSGDEITVGETTLRFLF